MHNNAIIHAKALIDAGTRRDTWTEDGFCYALRETTLDFWCLFAREWGSISYTMIAWFNQYGTNVEYTMAA